MSKKQSEPAGPRGKIVVISDTHFGDESQLLDNSALVDRLMEALAGRGAIRELVLLGDVLDLWVTTMIPAFRQARYFLRSLSMLPNLERIVYLPGNHDHLMFMNAFRDEMERLVMANELETPKFLPVRSYDETLLSAVADPSSEVPFSMVYPFIVREVNGREVILTHGHHLDFFDPDFGWARTFWLSKRIIKKRRKSATLHDIEMTNLPFCGAMSVVPWVPEMVEGGLRFYRLISFFARMLRRSNMQQSIMRDTLIKDTYDEIEGLLPILGHPSVGCFVFGHTHRPGLGRLPGGGTAVANTGAWTRNDEGVPSMTWVELDYDVKLFRLADSRAELMYSEGI